MTTNQEPIPADLTLSTWLQIEADVYLDARRPGWAAHERAGLVRYARPGGERHACVFVAPEAVDIIQALARPAETGPSVHSQAARPIGSLG